MRVELLIKFNGNKKLIYSTLHLNLCIWLHLFLGPTNVGHHQWWRTDQLRDRN